VFAFIRDIDIAIPSVRLSVTLRYCAKRLTRHRNSTNISGCS